MVCMPPFSLPASTNVYIIGSSFLPIDDCHRYSRAVLPAVCGIIWRAWEHRWIVEYVECDAVNWVLSCMVSRTMFTLVI